MLKVISITQRNDFSLYLSRKVSPWLWKHVTKANKKSNLQIHAIIRSLVSLCVSLWGVQVWGLLCLVRGNQMVFVCHGEQQRYSGGSFHRSALISLLHLQALCSYKHPQPMGLWCFCHCVYSEKSGKYVNFKTKRTRMNNGLGGSLNQLHWNLY